MHFLSSCRVQISEGYAAELERHVLPLEAEVLEEIHTLAYSKALVRFDKEKFGTESGANAGSLRWSNDLFLSQQ